jgi:hypothetical protein
MSARWDFFKLAAIAFVASSLLAILTAAIVSWENAASRNLALATGTLGAASTAFLIQLFFELRNSKELDHVSTEFTIDLSAPSIRQWNYTGTPAWRIGTETGASTWLSSNNTAAFTSDRDLLYHRWRSQRVDIATYKQWVARLLADAHDWFESDEPAGA